MAGSPLATMGAVHTAATLETFIAMECHAVDFISWWQELVTGVTQPVIKDGYVTVPGYARPGRGAERAGGEGALALSGLLRAERRSGIQAVQAAAAWPHFNVDGVWVNERTSDY